MLSAARLPQVRTDACISLQASWEQVSSSNCPNHVRRTKSSIKKRIIVRWTVRSMFGEQTFAQLRTGFRAKIIARCSPVNTELSSGSRHVYGLRICFFESCRSDSLLCLNRQWSFSFFLSFFFFFITKDILKKVLVVGFRVSRVFTKFS